MGPSHHLCFFFMQNSVISTRIASLNGSQPSSVVLCIQNSVISTRITSLSGSQPSSVVFACETATLGSELQVSMGPRRHLSFCACKTACLASESLGVPAFICGFCMQNSHFSTRNTSLFWSQTLSVVFACETATLGPELQVSMGPRPHLSYRAHKTA